MKQLPVVVAALTLLGGSLAAQVQQQARTIAFPTFTVDQNLARAKRAEIALGVGGLAVAKTKGVTPDEFGHTAAKIFAWSIGAGSPIRFTRTMQDNLRALGAVVEVLAASDTMVTYRTTRPWTTFFGGNGVAYGVTLSEYEASNAAFAEGIAEGLSLHYAQRIDSAYITATVNGVGKYPVRSFPRGKFRVTYTAADQPAYPDLPGSWEADFAPGGKYTLRKNGEVFVRVNYDLNFDEITFHDETMGTGQIGCPEPGRYRWTVNTANGSLTLGLLSDDCAQRIAFLTRRSLEKQ